MSTMAPVTDGENNTDGKSFKYWLIDYLSVLITYNFNITDNYLTR